MKTIFRNLRAFAVVAMVGMVATMAVSCEDPQEDKPNEKPTPSEPTEEVLEFALDSNTVIFAAGEEKVIAVKEGQTVVGATVEAPEGWTVVASEEGLTVTAPTQESINEGAAAAVGTVEVEAETENKIYKGSFNVVAGDTYVYVEQLSNTFKDVQIKVAIKGVDKYMMHFGTDGGWKGAFDEWQNPNPMLPEAPLFGWEGTLHDSTFEGSLFEFAKSPYMEDFMPMPGIAYELSILPIVEGKANTDYSYSDVYLYSFKTADAGENGAVTPQFELAGQTYNDVSVNVNAEGAYVTFWTFYKDAEYEQIKGRDKVIKENLVTMGEKSTSGEFVANKDNLNQGEKVHLAAISLDSEGNFGNLVIEEFFSGVYPFNDMVVTLGEITHSDDGRTIYVPVSVEGGELAYYRYAYVSSGNSDWTITYGGSIEKAEVKIANVPNEYYGPKFVQPEDLVDGKIVIQRGISPGVMGRILVLATDTDGNSSHAAYVEYTTTESQYQVIYKNDADYEYGIPSVSFKDVTSVRLQDGSLKHYANFNITLSEHTEAAWVCVAGEEYMDSFTPYQLLFSSTSSIIEGTFMFSQEYTENGVFAADTMYCYNTVESKSAVYVAWLDDNNFYHETALMYGPVEDAQSYLP